MQLLQSAFIPALLAWTGLYALYKGVDVFPTFLHGAKKGLQTAVGILPTMVGMLTVVYMLRASGAIDLAAALLAPVFQFFGIPKECTALALLKPISGGGGIGARQRNHAALRPGQLCRTGSGRDAGVF